MSSVLYYALPALGSYALLSIFLLRRPRLLHPPRAPAFRPRLGAHRGGEPGEEGVWASEGGLGRARHAPRWTAEGGGLRGQMSERGQPEEEEGRWRGDVGRGKRLPTWADG